jgi:serine/threonine-protein kinase HipA
MAVVKENNKQIWVYADWEHENQPFLMGILKADAVRGKEIFSFSYDINWLEKGTALLLDPGLVFYPGPQYNPDDKPNFGLFTDSSPDRWGRVLMERREAFNARKEGRRPTKLLESDYLLGVHDRYRMGGLRFKTDPDGPFLDDDASMPAPPFTSLRSLEEASLQFENADASEDPAFTQWLSLLMSPGSSLGGARPKASAVDPQGQLWIAKFPSIKDERDTGGWEAVVNDLAIRSGIHTAEGQARRFTRDYHTYLSKRFDRNGGRRIHFASAMTLLGYTDGADAASGVSYLHMAEFIMRHGAQTNADLEELWRRIVFNICISNSDDHLRNHGFLLTPKGWILSPCYDVNPVPLSTGLHLNITEFSNDLSLDLAREVASQFRVNKEKQVSIIERITIIISHWQEAAMRIGIKKTEIQSMETAFTAWYK